LVNCYRVVFYSFFFQAEDGIRVFHVTGVQTCALPICARDDGSAACMRRDDLDEPAPGEEKDAEIAHELPTRNRNSEQLTENVIHTHHPCAQRTLVGRRCAARTIWRSADCSRLLSPSNDRPAIDGP